MVQMPLAAQWVSNSKREKMEKKIEKEKRGKERVSEWEREREREREWERKNRREGDGKEWEEEMWKWTEQICLKIGLGGTFVRERERERERERDWEGGDVGGGIKKDGDLFTKGGYEKKIENLNGQRFVN